MNSGQPFARYTILSTIGTGAFGIVYLAHDIITNTKCAVKRVPTAVPYTQNAVFQDREIFLHKCASAHPNILRFHCAMVQGPFTYIVVDYAPDGDLGNMVFRQHRFMGNDTLIRTVFIQILDAVQHCHELGIFHRDLKPDNIMYSASGPVVAIGDFGLATPHEVSSEMGCGSPSYLSPENLGHNGERQYNTRYNDIWSLGVILYILITGKKPWSKPSLSDSSFARFVENPTSPHYFCSNSCITTPEVTCLLSRIWDLTPELRIDIPDLRRQINSIERFSQSSQIAIPSQASTPDWLRAFYRGLASYSPSESGTFSPEYQDCDTSDDEQVAGDESSDDPSLQTDQCSYPPQHNTPMEPKKPLHHTQSRYLPSPDFLSLFQDHAFTNPVGFSWGLA